MLVHVRRRDLGQSLTRRSALVATIVLALAGCECGREEPPPPSAPPTPRVTDPAPAPVIEPVATAAPLTIGYAPTPVEPDGDAEARNRAALARHRAGDFVASEAAFGALARERPSFLFARFNHACALARLERLDEAHAILEELLALDYPTFAPRLDADEDLAALRAGAHAEILADLRARIEAAYRAAMREGVPIVYVDDDPGERPGTARVVQAGVWLARERRFVPMGPRIVQGREEYEECIAATVLDAERGVVVAISGQGMRAEGGDYLRAARVGAWEAPTGRELERRLFSTVSLPEIHALPGGAALRHFDLERESFEEHPIDVLMAASEGRYDAARRPRLRCDQESCDVAWDGEVSLEVTRELGVTIAWGEGATTVTLDPAHRGHRHARTRTWSVRAERGAWVISRESISFDWTPGVGAAAISYVDRESGAVTRVLAGRGLAGARVGPDGSVYLQLGDRVERHAAGSLEGEALPPGLRIEAGPRHVFDADVYREL